MNNLQANICLLAVTLCWSCEVIIFSIIPDGVNPFATTCVTSLIGAALLGTCFARRIVAAFKRDRWQLARRVAGLGVMNTTYSVLFLVGLQHFDVSTGAFTISITVVVLPVMLLVMRRGVPLRTWLSAACVLAGIAVAIGPAFETSQVEGLVVMGIGRLVRALYIVKLNDYAREHDPLTLAAGMSGVNAVIAFFPWLAMQPATFFALPWSNELIAAYFIYGYFVIAFTISLNVLAQRRATPAQATVVYSTEIVFSTIWATCLPASVVDPVDLTLPLVVGCILIVVGNLVEIAPTASQKEPPSGAPEPAAGTAEPPSGAPEPAARTTAPAQTADLVSIALARVRRPAMRKVVLFAILLGVYLVIALPFKVLGIIPGCFALAVGNLIGDIASDSLRWSSIAGFVGNFVYPYLMYLFWTKLRKREFNLRTVRAIALFIATVIVCACVQSLIISPVVALFYPEVDVMLFAGSVVANGTLFPIGFSIPFIIMLQEEIGFSPLHSRGRVNGGGA